MKLGLTISNINKNVFCNGINQNIIFIYDFYNKNGIDCYLISNEKSDKYKVKLNNREGLLQFDTIIVIGLSINYDIIEELIKKKIYIIKYILGNEYVYLSNFILSNQSGLHVCKYQYNETWIVKQFEYSIDYYKYLYKTANIKTAPYVWDKKFMDDIDLIDLNKINIGILEPNIVTNKSCFYPIIICERANSIINKVYVTCSDKIKKNENFIDFVKKSELYHNHKISFENRLPVKLLYEKYINIIVSFVENWDYNYIYMECFYYGIPLIHNSKLLKDFGYYYDTYNVETASKYIYDIKKSFNRQDYIEKNKNIFFLFSLNNETNKHFFLKNIYSKNYYNKKLYNREKCWYMYGEYGMCSLINHKFENFGFTVNGSLPNEEFHKIEKIIKNKNKNICSFVISLSDEKKQQMKQKIDGFSIFPKMEKFKENIDYKEKHKIVLMSHYKCWKIAQDMDLEEAFFFEDDIIFVKNWKSIITEFINKYNPDIIKMDCLPYRIYEIDNENVYFYKSLFGACMGGYYLKRHVINYLIDSIDNMDSELDNINTCENIFCSILQKFNDKLYSSVPNLCIQDWYKQPSSNIHGVDHMTKLKNMQNDVYFPLYGDFYELD